MDELLEFVPGGPWLLGALVLLSLPSVRRRLRPAAKATIKAALGISEMVRPPASAAVVQQPAAAEQAPDEKPAPKRAQRVTPIRRRSPPPDGAPKT
jgi:hypothetical protein